MRFRNMISLVYLSLSAASGALFAQQLTLSNPPTQAGSAVTLTLTLDAASAAPAGLEWTVSSASGQVLSASTGPAADAAGKSLSCTSGNGAYSCVLTGLNSIGMGSGDVAYITVVPQVDNAPFAVSGGSAVSADGTALPLAVNTASPATPGSSGSTYPPARLWSVSCSPQYLRPGQTATCTVTLAAAAPADTVVNVLTGNWYLIIPASVTVPAGSNSAQFPLQAAWNAFPQLAGYGVVLNGNCITETVTILSWR